MEATHGYPHNDLLAHIQGTCPWSLEDIEDWRTPDKKEMVVTYDLPTLPSPLEDSAIFLTALNATDWRLSTRLFVGVRLREGDVRFPFFEYPLGKQRKGSRLQSRIKTTWEGVRDDLQSVGRIVRELQQWELPSELSDQLLLRAARGRFVTACASSPERIDSDLMPWSRAGVMDELYRQGERTALHLLFCFATVARRNPPLKRVGQTYRFYQCLVSQGPDAHDDHPNPGQGSET
jgi:hypothetical protein